MTALEVPAQLLGQMISPSPVVLAGALGAFTVGLTGSIHCLLMCGPLACAMVMLELLDEIERLRARLPPSASAPPSTAPRTDV